MLRPASSPPIAFFEGFTVLRRPSSREVELAGGLKKGFRTLSIAADSPLESELVNARLSGRAPVAPDESPRSDRPLAYPPKTSDDVDLTAIVELIGRTGVPGRLQPHPKGYRLLSPGMGDTLFTTHETQLLRPTQREREHASSLGLSAWGVDIRTRRGSPSESALLAFRAEHGRPRNAGETRQPPAAAPNETLQQELMRKAAQCFQELDVDAEIAGADFAYRGSVVAHVERSGSSALLVKTPIQAFALPLGDGHTFELTDETLEAVQTLVDKFEPLIAEADALCAKAEAVGCLLSRKPRGEVGAIARSAIEGSRPEDSSLHQLP